MDILGLSGDRKRQRINLEGKIQWVVLFVWVVECSVVEGGEGMMDNNCIQYRVTGGGGGTGPPAESSGSSNGSMTYRVVNSSEGETSSPSRTSISSNSSALSNVQVWPGLVPGVATKLTFNVAGCAGQSDQWAVLRDWKPKWRSGRRWAEDHRSQDGSLHAGLQPASQQRGQTRNTASHA